MRLFTHSFGKALRRCLLCAALACLPLSAQAAPLANAHALVITNDYAGSPFPLDGINFDRAQAIDMARLLGVTPERLQTASNASLPRMREELNGMLARVRTGDSVFIYYSGHGSQYAKPRPAKGENKCSEALVANDAKSFYLDAELETLLKTLSRRAAQVVVMNDSCFSGGAATKPLGAQSSSQAKTLPRPSSNANDASYTCGEAINKGWRAIFLNLQETLAKHSPLPAPARAQARQQEFRPRLIYLAAASDNEVAYATPQGSRATRAWAHCLKQNPAQNGKQLLRCAQARLNGDGADASPAGEQQTLNLVGDGDIPLRLNAAYPD
ncbi:caspase family protein [Massilia sp. W12]|uniref:caspase family protein n=1 Tax=Massilia sp. W12 TaxID=3126507 RepID=UPI0030D560B7